MLQINFFLSRHSFTHSIEVYWHGQYPFKVWSQGAGQGYSGWDLKGECISMLGENDAGLPLVAGRHTTKRTARYYTTN